MSKSIALSMVLAASMSLAAVGTAKRRGEGEMPDGGKLDNGHIDTNAAGLGTITAAPAFLIVGC